MVSVPVSRSRSIQRQPLDVRPLRYAETRNLVGPAVERFGNALGDAAEEIDRIKASQDRGAMLTADNAHTAFLAERQREFGQLRGDEASSRLEDYLKGIENHAQQLEEGAQSKRAREMIRRSLQQRNTLAKDSLSKHAISEGFEYEKQGLVAGRNLAVQDAVAAEGADQFGVAVGVGLTRLEEYANLVGMPDEARTLAKQQFFDEVHGSRLDRMFASPDPDIDAIGKYLDDYDSQISPGLENETWARLQAPLQGRVSRSDADVVMGYMAPGREEEAKPPALAVPKGPQGDVGGVLSRAGYSPAVVAGFLGNFDVEGGYHGALGDGGSASGIAQWRHDRRENFKRKFGKEPHEATAAQQAEFVVWEMQNPGKAGMSVSARDAILNAKSPAEAAELIDQHYERSSGQHRAQRKAAAEKYGGAGYESGPREWDRSQVYANLEAVADKEGWNPERVERARAELDRRINRDEGLLGEQRADADEQVTQLVNGLGDGFKSVEQIPTALRNRLAPADLAAWQRLAEANNRAVEPVSNGARAMELNLMRFYEPDRFKSLNLGHFAGDVTRAEMEGLLTTQAKMRTQESAWSPRSGITTALSYGKKINQLDLKPQDEAAILQIMEAEAQARFAANGGKPLTDSDYQDLFRSATRDVRTKTSFLGISTGTSEKPRYELSLDNMPDSTRSRLTQRLRDAGLPVNDENLLRLYRLGQ